jgi:hypothetical protein
LLVGLAAIFGFGLFSTDVSQAYLQSADKLMRKVYIKPTEEFALDENHVLQLLRPLYGLADSGDYWFRTISSHLSNELSMERTSFDSAFFYKVLDEKLGGMCATYVDECLHAGTDQYSKSAEKTELRFQCREREYDNVTFAGVEIKKSEDGFVMNQRSYVNKLMFLNKKANFSDYRSMRAKLAWTTHTRPDVCCAVAQAAQVTVEVFDKEPEKYCADLNKVLKHLKSCEVYLRFPKLDVETLRLQVYSDASYANNRDLSSQLGYIVFLAEAKNNCQPLLFSSHKSRRVTRSVLGSELALADGFDVAYIFKHDIQRMAKRNVPITIFRESLSLFDVITKATVTTERRLMIDLEVVKDAYAKREIEMLGFIRTFSNPADALTKVGRCTTLESILCAARIDHPIEQWIERSK